VVFILLLIYLCCTNNWRNIPADFSFSCWCTGIRLPFCVFWSLFSFYQWCVGQGDCGSGIIVAEEVDLLGDKGSGDTTMVIVEALLESFLNISLRSACISDEMVCW
jgi:hypothetical protein